MTAMKITPSIAQALPFVLQSMMVAATMDANHDGKISTEEGKAAAKAEVQAVLANFPQLRESFGKDPEKLDRVADKIIELAAEFVHGS